MTVSVDRPWWRHLTIIAAVAALAYGVAVVGAALSALNGGGNIDASLLVQWPLIDLAYWYVPVLLAIFAFEVVHLGWRDSPLCRLLQGTKPSHRSDVFYLATELFGVGPLMVVVASLGISAGIDAVLAEPRSWRPAAGLPILIAALLFFLVESFTTYWSHRFLHTPLMWPFHAIHHAADEMTAVTTTRHHPIDSAFGGVTSGVPAALLGFAPDAIFAAMVASGIATTVLHTRLPILPWFEKYVVAGPRLHGIHHSSDPADHNSNFSLFPLYDRLFGTYRWHERPLSFGAGDPRFDTGRPLHDMISAYEIWLVGLRAWPLAPTANPTAGETSPKKHEHLQSI